MKLVAYCPRKNKLYVFDYRKCKFSVSDKDKPTKPGYYDLIGLL